MQKRAPSHASKIYLIRCGLEDQWFNTSPTPIPLAPQLLSVARLDEHKNPLLLIRAAAALRDAGETFQLVIAGDGPLRSLVEQERAKLQLEDCIAVVGWRSQEQVVLHLQQSRALLLSSRCEGLPIAIMEAFAAGRPVIATDVGGVGELVVNGDTGWLVPADDCSALVAAMRQCLQASVEHLARLAAAGRQRVIQHHNINASATALAALLKPFSSAR